MALHQLAQPEEYLRFARDNAQEIEALFRDLLIGVTNFFRDPTAFEALEETVIPRLLSEKSAHDPVRVWVAAAPPARKRTRSPSCCTSTDAESSGAQGAGLRHRHRPAGDRTGARGVYPDSIAADVSEERLARFFTLDQRGVYRVQKHIRDMVVFSEQDVIKDPPFSRLDLRELPQPADLPERRLAAPARCRCSTTRWHPMASCSSAPPRRWAITRACFRWSTASGRSTRGWPATSWRRARCCPISPRIPALAHAPRGPHEPIERHEEPANLRQLTERALLAHTRKAGVMIDARGRILHIVGRTGKYLEPADGDASMNILEMAREGLRRELTVALHRAVSHREPVSYSGLRIKANGGHVKVNLAVQPVEFGRGSVHYLVVLEEAPAPAKGAKEQAAAERTRRSHRRARARTARQGRLPADHARGDGDHQRGTEVDQRGDAVDQRRAAVDQRRARDVEGGAAIGERGAGDRQRRAAGQGGRSLACEQRHEQPAGRHRCRHGVRRPSGAHLALHAGGHAGDQPDRDRRRPAARRT